jgi:hypothetical protein
MGYRIIQIISKLDGWVVFLVLAGSILISGLVDEDHRWMYFLATSLKFVVIFGWLLSVGESLNEKLPVEEHEDLTLFRTANIYAMLFCPLSQLAMYFLDPAWYDVVLPFLVLFVITFLYAIYKSSMIFVTAQRQLREEEQLSGGEIILAFLFFFIGVWVIQSRVRRLVS